MEVEKVKRPNPFDKHVYLHPELDVSPIDIAYTSSHEDYDKGARRRRP